MRILPYRGSIQLDIENLNIFIEFCSTVGHPVKLNKNIQQSFQYPIELSPKSMRFVVHFKHAGKGVLNFDATCMLLQLHLRLEKSA